MIDSTTRELFIYDDIGPAWAGMIGTETIRNGLTELGEGDITIRVNSYGGSVDEGLAMLEVLARHKGNVSVSVDSIAASAASLFPVAFPSTAAKHSRIMIHNPWGVVMGDANEMRKTADVLDSYRDSVAGVYELKMNASREEIIRLMDDETWYSAEEAVEAGLLDSVTESAAVEAKKVSPSRFQNTPKDLVGVSQPETEPERVDIAARVAAKLRAIRIRSELLKRAI